MISLDLNGLSLSVVVCSLSLCVGIFMYQKYSSVVQKYSQIYTRVVAAKLLTGRSDYIWKWRKNTPRIIKYGADKIMSIDKESVRLNTSHIPSERIYIEEANEVCKDGHFIASRLNEIESILKFMDIENEGSLKLTKNETFKLFGSLDPWYLKITYLGHSNTEKRIEARRFTVLYKLEESSEFNFPPYSTQDSIRVGFSAPKIKSAKLESGKHMFCLENVKQYSGLKYDFYNSCPHKEIVKDYIDNPETVIVHTKDKTLHVNSYKFV
jgi:hypothetical protein